MTVNKYVFVTGSAWKMIESISIKGTSLIISIILARLLMPEDYGIVALTSVFIQFSTIFVQGGLSTALVREKETSLEDYSNAFFVSLVIATVCYIGFFLVAPYISIFYSEPILIPILRIQMLSLFPCALGTVSNAICVRKFQFKVLCKINFLSSLISGCLGITLAYCGLGVWALVLYTLSRDGLSALLLAFAVKWKPEFSVSVEKTKKLWSFSIWVLLTTLLDFVGNNFFSILCGKYYSIADLGYMNKGIQLPELLCLHTFGAITSVMLPAMSELQNDKEQLKRITRKIVMNSSYIIFPVMTGLGLIAVPLVQLLFTEKWLPCVPILWAACFLYGTNIFRSINMQLIYAAGDSKEGMKIETIRFYGMIAGTICVTAFLNIGIHGFILMKIGVTFIVVLITQHKIKRIIPYSFAEWILDIAPALGLSTAMGVTVFLVGRIYKSFSAIMWIQIMVGIASYAVFSWIFQVKSFKELSEVGLDLLKKIKHRIQK